MIAPTLLVGLGGTGSKIVTKVANMVSKEQRQRISVAVFDTDINELREIQEANPFVKTIQTSTRLSVGEYLGIDAHARDTWFPVNEILSSKSLSEGAGQVRAISRLALDTAIRAGKMEPLHEAIEDLYKLEGDQSEQSLRVTIVSSLAGGTGSGLILPIALYIKNYMATRFQQSSNITRGFFILPEVFYEVIHGQAERNNLKCNAYATLRELDAFLMKGDATLPEKYRETTKIEFPRVGSEEYETYDVRPFDFCFLFDAQNTEGKKLNSFSEYLDHAANGIYAQSIGPMNKRSNSSEDNTIRELCAEHGRNRYAGAGSSKLEYPTEVIKEFMALNWAKECVSQQWMRFDDMYKDQVRDAAEMRSKGIMVKDVDAATSYMISVESDVDNNAPFALAIKNACSCFDEEGIIAVGDKWDEYLMHLKDNVEKRAENMQQLNDIKDRILRLRSGIEGGKGTNEALMNTYHEMKKYYAMAQKYCEDFGRTTAYTMFRAKNETSVTKDKQDFRLETYLYDQKGNFIHPNAVRYFLYKTLESMTQESLLVESELDSLTDFFKNFEKAFDDSKTEDVEETAEDLANRRESGFGGLKAWQTELLSKYTVYMQNVDKYRNYIILSAVLKEGMAYISKLCRAFENFYNSFGDKVSEIEKRIGMLRVRFDHTKGTAARYVCASSTCMDAMLKEMPYVGGVINIDSDLAESIYNRVREFSLLDDLVSENEDTDNDQAISDAESKIEEFFSELFNKDIIGYFKQSLMKSYSASIKMDILTALEKEAYYEKNSTDNDKVQQYIKKVIRQTRALANPFIERPLGEETAPITACAYNTDLDPKDGSQRSLLISAELGNYGGVADEDIGENMILFYQSIYGLRANKLSKFAPKGEYFKAYFELIDQIKPLSDDTPVITPHIDKNWHTLYALPDLDEGNQRESEEKAFKAFLFSILFDYVRYEPIAKGRCRYRLYTHGGKPEEFVVTNKTPCDNFYEVFDAFSINPVAVKSVLASAEKRLQKERFSREPVKFSTGLMKTKLDNLFIDEYNKEVSTLFDIAMFMRVSSPAAVFDNELGEDMLRVFFAVYYNYIKSISAKNEVDEVYATFIIEQYEAFSKNLPWYTSQWDNLETYINSILNIAIDDLESKELDEAAETIREKIKTARKAETQTEN